MTFQNWKNTYIEETYTFSLQYCKENPLHRNFDLSKVQSVADSIIHYDKCTLMVVSNLAQPEWLRIRCNEPLLSNIYCKIENQSKTDFIQKQDNRKHHCINTNQIRLSKIATLSSGFSKEKQRCLNFKMDINSFK